MEKESLPFINIDAMETSIRNTKSEKKLWRTRSLRGLGLLLLFLAGLSRLIRLGYLPEKIRIQVDVSAVPVTKELVPLEAHIMSKCPDARDCLRQLVLPTMQRVYDKVNFTLSYIGTPTDNDGVSCMHGAPECAGNIIELCASHIYPDPKIYLGFTMCLSRDYQDIPDRNLVEDCSLEHGIDFEKLNECMIKEDGGLALRNPAQSDWMKRYIA
ncbi:hypothetical protein B7463_g6857, partial [Scytalidium lignicola]